MHTNHSSTKLFLNSPFTGWQRLILGLLRVCHVHNERVRLKDKTTHLCCICRADVHILSIERALVAPVRPAAAAAAERRPLGTSLTPWNSLFSRK